MIETTNFNFLKEHFELLKPTPLANTVPASIDLRGFFKNNHGKLDDTLPYISYGGYVSFDRNIDVRIHTGDYYLCMYVCI